MVGKFKRGFWLVAGVVSLSALGAPRSYVRKPDEAPREGMMPGRWSSAIKQAFGTSFEAYDSDGKYSAQSPTAPLSKVWFTAAQGVLTEVFWPTLDTAQVRDSQFLVSDGKSFLFEERHNSQTVVERPTAGVPSFVITNQDPQGRFTIEKTLFTDSDRDVVFQHVRIETSVPGLRFYVLHNPAVSNIPMGNSAQASSGKDVLGSGLYAWRGDQAQVLTLSVPFKKVSAAFEGPYDGFQDLRADFQMDYVFQKALNGNVVLMGWIDLPETAGTYEFDMALAFAPTPAAAFELAQNSFQRGFRDLYQTYVSDWLSYQQSLRDLSILSSDFGKLFRDSIAVLKSSEDKSSEGAFIASPSVPWGEHSEDWNADTPYGSRAKLTSGYHVVWPRDLYQTATALMAVGDFESAAASLAFLRRVQYPDNSGEWTFGSRHIPKAGAFPQNCWVNGEPFWPGLQMDEVAYPVILAYRLWKSGQVRWEDNWVMVRRAADHILNHGPWSPQERWEENFGASPSNIASMISALWGASEMATMAQDLKRAEAYRTAADNWSAKPGDNLDTWLFTTSGAHGSGRYYVRLEGAGSPDQAWDPNDDSTFVMANGAGRWREKDVTDAGFLELVRLGVRSPLSSNMLESVPVIDQTIRKEIPNVGPGFYRYLGDRYNYDDVTGKNTRGMAWPLLTGERGHYEIARASEEGRSFRDIVAISALYIETMENMATPTGMIPEQVWDSGARAGLPTGAATPLAWSHAEYIKLLRSAMDGKPFDLLPSVRERTRQLTDR